jgi:superfamily I DNA and RNA helicase
MTWYSSKRATTVVTEGKDCQVCYYHQTGVVKWDNNLVCLNSGGYRTHTTKTRMNEVSEHYNLGFSVFQKKGQWFVEIADGTIMPFSDNMIISYTGTWPTAREF